MREVVHGPRLRDALFERHGVTPVEQLDSVGEGELDTPLRHEADDLAVRDIDAVTGGGCRHHVEGVMQRDGRKVGQVHRHLRLSVNHEAKRLQSGQAAVRRTDLVRDGLSLRQVRRMAHEDVEGAEELASADGDRACRGMERGWPRVWWTCGSDGLLQRLEPAVPHVRQVAILGALRGVIVEVHRDAELLAHAIREVTRDTHAIVHRAAVEWNEGDDVGGADARVNARVRGDVDPVACGADRRERGSDHVVMICHERDHRAVVRRIERPVQHTPVRVTYGGDDRLDHGGITAFRKIRDTLDQ